MTSAIPTNLLETIVTPVPWINNNEKSKQESNDLWLVKSMQDMVVPPKSTHCINLLLGFEILKPTDFVVVELNETLIANHISLHKAIFFNRCDSINITVENNTNRPFPIKINDEICFVKYFTHNK